MSDISQSEQPQLCDPVKRFRTILADPPWPRVGAKRHYDTMDLESIKTLPVADLAEDEAHLWLWCTNSTLVAAHEVAKAWGFTPRSPLTWVKMFRLGLSSPYSLRNATEHVLFCTKGGTGAKVNFHSQPTWFTAPVAEHSRKPAEQFAIIERISKPPFLELFSRRQPESNHPWDTWGLEAMPSTITIPGYPVPSDFDGTHELNQPPIGADFETTARARGARS